MSMDASKFDFDCLDAFSFESTFQQLYLCLILSFEPKSYSLLKFAISFIQLIFVFISTIYLRDHFLPLVEENWSGTNFFFYWEKILFMIVNT
jgi:hypothetical protein